MRKYYDHLDDYTDTRPSRLMGLTKSIVPAIIFVGCLFVIFGICGNLEMLR